MDKITAINWVIADYFQKNTAVDTVPAKDLMPIFINAGIFDKDEKAGLPIRKILRDLDKKQQLSKIPSVMAVRKAINTSWFFGRQQSADITPLTSLKDFIPVKQKSKPAGGRTDSDEYYVIDLCDEVLVIKGSRQHKFDFLRGDAGTRLPVDVYYESLQLVVEFNEHQHTKAVMHFDKPDKLTISGVHRGEQRKLYDKRKRTVLPQHGIAVIDISYSSFECDSRGKIRRDEVRDVKW